MARTTALAARIRRLEESVSAGGIPPNRQLPHIVEPDQLQCEEARKLRQQGRVVVTFEQCAELMV